MIYDIINTIVVVILAQLFCSTFLERKEFSPFWSVVITLLWIMAGVAAGNIFENALLLRIIVVIGIIIVFSLLIYKKHNIIMSIAVPFLFYVMAIVCEFFVIAIHRYLDPNMRIEKLMDSDISIYMGIASQFIQLAVVFIIRRLFHKSETNQISSKIWLTYTVFPLYSLSLIALFAYSFEGTLNEFQKNAFTYIACSLLLINLFIYWFIKQESQRILMTQKNEMEIVHAKGVLQLYEQITKERDILGKREHEYKNTITALKGLIADKQYDKIKEILDVQNSELINNANVFETGNKLINAILNTKYVEAGEKGISFRFVINDLSRLTIEDRDCIVILTNILNNAIEAAEKCENGQRFISIKAVIENEQFIFACRNSYVSDNEKELKSKKKDVVSHGYGIDNIRQAVLRNKGNFHFEREDHEFVAVAMIPL